MAELFPLAPGNAAPSLSRIKHSFSDPDPTAYMWMDTIRYDPEIPRLPDYSKTVIDCGSLFGNSCLAGMYGWDFSRSCEFWRAGIPLTEVDRERTLLGRRIKMIGLDVVPLALKYSKKMNTIDEFIVQDFSKETTEETREALLEADVMMVLQCTHFMPTATFRHWVDVFLTDRTQQKRLVYGSMPVIETRDMSPKTLLKDVQGMEYTEKTYGVVYSTKMTDECPDFRSKPPDQLDTHYQVDFLPISPSA